MLPDPLDWKDQRDFGFGRMGMISTRMCRGGGGVSVGGARGRTTCMSRQGGRWGDEGLEEVMECSLSADAREEPSDAED